MTNINNQSRLNKHYAVQSLTTLMKIAQALIYLIDSDIKISFQNVAHIIKHNPRALYANKLASQLIKFYAEKLNFKLFYRTLEELEKQSKVKKTK